MERGLTVRGRLHGRQIDLDETVDAADGEVEVIVRPVETPATPPQDVFEFIRSLPLGTRTKEDIDQQIADERDSWGER